MTTTDKTGEQLVQSIRKTKATSATRSQTATTPGSRAKAKSAAAEVAPGRAADPYQRGRRVWPD